MCRVNSTSANHKASTKTQTQHINSTNTQKRTTKQTDNMAAVKKR